MKKQKATENPLSPAIIDIVNTELPGVPPARREYIGVRFNESIVNIFSLDKEIESLNSVEPTMEDIAKAKTIKKTLIGLRGTSGAGAVKEELKRDLLEETKLIDNLFRTVTNEANKREAIVESIEKHFENKEKERINKLRAEREAELNQFEYNYQYENLGLLSDEAFNAKRETAKQTFEALKFQREQQAENERKEELLKERNKLVFYRLSQLSAHGYKTNNPDSLADLAEEEYIKLLENEAKKAQREKQVTDRIGRAIAAGMFFDDLTDSYVHKSGAAIDLYLFQNATDQQFSTLLAEAIDRIIKFESSSILSPPLNQVNSPDISVKIESDKKRLRQVFETFKNYKFPVMESNEGVNAVNSIILQFNVLMNTIIQEGRKL